ncbi:MAG: PAS domain-containing protein [Pseudomonadota bacterium]
MEKTPDIPTNIIDISSFQATAGYQKIAQIEAYWEALRGNRIAPKRAEIDPRGIEDALAHAFIVERTALGVGKLRIAGCHLSDLMGMEIRGMPLAALFTSATRKELTALLEEAFQTPAVIHASLTSFEAANRPYLDGRLILLPLQSDLGDISRILGCLVTKGNIGEPPRRFTLKSHEIRPLIDRDPGWHMAPTPAARPSLPPSGFQEPATPFSAAARAAPYLRLVKSDEDPY